MKRIFYFLIVLPFILVSCEKSPVAHFYIDFDEPSVGQDILFHNDSENADSYTWDFGDGFSSNEANPHHTYNSNGTFKVSLTVSSRNGNEDKTVLDITVYIPTLLEIEVREYYQDYVVPGASVLLFNSLADWNEGDVKKSRIEGIADNNGITVFANLDPFVYYVDVWEKDHDNYQLAKEDVGFIRTPEVMPHQINRFLALVDKVVHTGAKGTKSASPRVLAIIRNPDPAKQLPNGGTEGWRELYERRTNK